MRLHILSDLHLEFGPFEPPPVQADVIVLAGDVHIGKNGLAWIQTAFRDRAVIYVLGNHEYYDQPIPQLAEELKALAKGTHVRVLENDRVEIDGVVFLGTTLWTDFELLGNRASSEADALGGVADFQCIRLADSDRAFRPVDARRLHANSVEWLGGQVQQTAGKRLVIVTHHAPSRRSIAPCHAHNALNPAFASDLDRLVTGSNAALWVHGHSHYATDYLLGSTRIVNNPRGYPDELVEGFNPGLVIEV
jgi:predicted phosphodiesterase